jgi:hypothetical protein
MAAALPPSWEAAKDPQTGRTYYQNHETKETQWHPPGTQPGPVAPAANPNAAAPAAPQQGPTTVPVPPAGQLPVQMSMAPTAAATKRTQSMTERVFGAKAEVHPLIEKLEAGLKIYSQSFWDDCWLTFKNSHIVVSCFTVHPKHHFTAGERAGVLFSSLFVAFGISASLESQAGDSGSVATTIYFAALSFAMQYAYDYFAEASVSCSCVQRSERCIKDAFECIGKFAFLYLAFIAFGLFAAGIAFLGRGTEDNSVAIALISFVVTRAANFLFSSSLSHLVFFAYYRKSQMKPPAEVLDTEEGQKKWTTKTRPPFLCCLTPEAPCEKWDQHIGVATTFADLPLHAPDYDWRVKISFICWSRIIFEHKAKTAEDAQQVRDSGCHFSRS